MQATLDSFPAQLSDPSMQEQNGFAIDLIEQLEWELGVDMAFEPLPAPLRTSSLRTPHLLRRHFHPAYSSPGKASLPACNTSGSAHRTSGGRLWAPGWRLFTSIYSGIYISVPGRW